MKVFFGKKRVRSGDPKQKRSERRCASVCPVGTALIILNSVAAGLSPAWGRTGQKKATPIGAGLARLALPHASISLAENPS